jgi:K+-sensing histidine kinase KdpD
MRQSISVVQLNRIGAVAVPIGVAAVIIPWRTTFALPAAALILVAAIAVLSIRGDRASGYLAAIVATLSFDFFLTRPYERLSIISRPDIETTICLFVVGVVITEVSVLSRLRHQRALDESGYVALMHRVSEEVASGRSTAEVIEAARTGLFALLSLRAARYESGTAERRRARVEPDGTIISGAITWSNESLGLPGPELEIAVRDRGRQIGRFVLTPTPGLPVPTRRLMVAAALCDLVGSALASVPRSA